MLSTSKLADDELQNERTEENTACDIVTKKNQLEFIFEKLRSKVNASSI